MIIKNIKSTTLRKVCFLLVILFLIPNVFSQGNIAVSSTVDRDHILIGDVITYSVIVEHDADVEIVMPSLAENLGMFEIRDYDDMAPRTIDDKIVKQTDYSISTFDTGDYVIPELEINYRTQGDSSWQSIKTEPIEIIVESLNPDEAGDIRDIKPPLTPPRDYRTLIVLIFLGLLILVATIFVIYYIKRLREGKSLIPKRSKPPRPAHEIALESLAGLKNSDLLAGHVKEYYTELSDIVRQYIEDRFFIMAMEMTTTQLLSSMLDQGFEEKIIEPVRAILTKSDLVKFARFIPSAEEHDAAWQLAVDFVENTKLVFEPEDQKVQAESQENDIVVEESETVKEEGQDV
ncbi:hypothetical protein EH223_17690 [candidate division KSB1 bacterium]|nr:hypothetical protein [candidate division KSB1 bacterium]RQW00582.1 MAG: hypothetical protein EH223_17690 [candidate division KSB1 bacterium]